MGVNNNLKMRALVDTATAPWVPSPEPGVERILLDRDGEEVARATSLVRYAPGARFPGHLHARGEEFLVLAGEFRDEHGAYPAGTYVRNPWGTRHAPFSPGGCVLFVKLRQMLEADRRRLCLPRIVDDCVLAEGATARVVVLHESQGEHVAIVRWEPAHAAPSHVHPDGEELLVLAGDLQDEHGVYPAGTWLRQPPGSEHRPWTRSGCLLYLKRGPGVGTTAP